MKKKLTCGELRISNVDQEVSLYGWVNRRRDQGGLIFIDLRDRWGITQVVIDRDHNLATHEIASEARTEYVLAVKGIVRKRPEGTDNPDLPTGEIDVYADEIEILNTSKTPPIYINRDDPVDENLRMRYRYLDLRRPNMQKNIILRHKIVKYIRDFMDEREFVEVETPILFKATPEGARDFLVPSRLQPGKFYALPQSPQQLKQLLMVAGYERYFQIARCFRDEDLRGDRQLEFTQLDFELSFVEREDVMQLAEEMMLALAKNTVPNKKILAEPIPRILYQDAMELYGTDRPDIRYDLKAIDISDLAGKSGFSVFVSNVEAGKPVKCIRVPEYTKDMSNTKLKSVTGELETLARGVGAKGLAWMAIPEEEDGQVKGPIGKFFTVDQTVALFERVNAGPNDLLLFVSDERAIVQAVVEKIRPHLAQELGLVDPEVLSFCWVIDFPLFLWDEENERWDPSQHMFTMPMPEDLPLLETDPGRARGSQYDLVCNGYEVGGGSIRIHRREIQEKIFPLIGQDMAHAKEEFGHMLEAFEYGAPPHGGMAWGIDRVAMLFAGEPNIREVIAFPKTQTGADVMANAPSLVTELQLAELFIELNLPEPEADPE